MLRMALAIQPDARGAVVETSKYEALLNESMRLFNLKGYRDTSMEDIAAAVGMPASGIYRYFSGKSDILAAAFRRAADRLSADLSTIVSTVPDREEALDRGHRRVRDKVVRSTRNWTTCTTASGST